MGLRDRIGNWMSQQFPSETDTDDGPSGAGVRHRPRPSAPSADGEMELVNGEVFEDDMIEVDAALPAYQSSHFERYRKLIDSFDEDRETPLEKSVRWLFLVLAYVLPVAVAYAMGKEIGD